MRLLGIDVGTTGLKAALYDEKLNEISSVGVEYTLDSHGDFVQFDAEEYYTMMLAAIDRVTEGRKFDALSIDTQGETLIVTDKDFKPLMPAIVWLDNRATAEAKEIEKHFGRKKVYDITGQPEIASTWPASKILWIKNNKKEIFDKISHIFLLEDWLIYKMTGNIVCEPSLHSSSIWIDIKKKCYWKEMLDFIGINENQLPPIHKSGEIVGEFRGAKVVSGVLDQIAGAVGAGVIRTDMISETTGTALAIVAPVSEMPEFNENSIIPCHVNYDGSYTLLLWAQTAGMTLKWFRDSFASGKSFDELGELASGVEIGCNGLTFIPHLCGSSMPDYNPNARGAFFGVSLEHNIAHFSRAIMEAVCCMLKADIDYIGGKYTEIRSMGGGAKSKIWCRMKADMLGKKLVTLKRNETATLGSAIIAGVAIGAFDSIESACSLIETRDEYLPIKENDYTEVYQRYLKREKIITKDKA